MSNLFTLPVVLVLTEDLGKAAFLKKVLKDECHLLEHRNAKQALEIAKTSLLDIVVVDADLSETAPFDFCRDIRKIAAYFEVPIVLITHNLKKTFVEQATEAGVTGFLHEPLDKNEIDQRIVSSLRLKAQEKNLAESGLFSKPSILSAKTMKEINAARRLGGHLSILMIEADGAEKLSKDSVELIVTTLRHHIRKLDVLIVYGHGKFVLLLPKTSQRAGEVIAETLRAEVARIAAQPPLTISIGLIAFDSSIEHYDDLIENVSLAVTEAKLTGNRIVIKSTEEPV